LFWKVERQTLILINSVYFFEGIKDNEDKRGNFLLHPKYTKQIKKFYEIVFILIFLCFLTFLDTLNISAIISVTDQELHISKGADYFRTKIF